MCAAQYGTMASTLARRFHGHRALYAASASPVGRIAGRGSSTDANEFFGGSSGSSSSAYSDDPVFVNTKLHIARAQQQAVNKHGLVQCVPDAFEYLKMILDSKVYDVCKETDLQFAPKLSARIRNRVLLKREDQQPVYSFKLRGAYNKVVQLTSEEKARGIVCCSAGNHAQGIAYSANKLGISAKIFMPTVTPSIKVDSVRQFANKESQVCLVGDSYDEAYEACMKCVDEEGRVLVHPFNDPHVIAGQGSIGNEILKQATSENIDAVFCCVGGGGLLSGVGLYLKCLKPSIKIIGVEAADAPTMTEALRVGKVVDLPSVGLFADGAAVKRAGDETFRICQWVVDEMITVSTDEICSAIKDMFVDTRVVLEPAGALAAAGMKKYAARTGAEGRTFVAVTSGANMDFDRLRFISERADNSETLISVTIPERPGAFIDFYKVIFPRNVTEFAYRISRKETSADGSGASICMSFQAASEQDKHTVLDGLDRAGYKARDLSGDEMAKTHGRHLVGGRAPRELTDGEILFRFEFPERPGALSRFLENLPEDVNISLFHYRNFGSDVGKVLAAFQIPDEDMKRSFREYLKLLRAKGYNMVEETENPLYQEFMLESMQDVLL
eukprot:TRINITY_DN15012_c1_g1_i1.p1 TRINITY_DN15012_c1_g1~~TRINITY_DN15012_c1_g1_i1.p1  ORF type:complete len:614 (-),score=116.17 TRINITY_DN15012_c1_g1_i1:71-1912(-)